MANFVPYDRTQPFLLPPDLKDWVPEDDLAHFIVAAVERVPLSSFKINDRGSGKAQYHPRMMLALLVYCYANGLFSSRRIERATYRDLGVRYVAVDTHPDHDTIALFRRKPPPRIIEPWRLAMKAKLESDDGKARYRKRKQTVEPVFGIIKSAMGFVRFHLRGLENVTTEWALTALAYNCRRLTRLQAA